MRALPADLRRALEGAVLEGRRAAEAGVRAALASLGVAEKDKPGHLSEEQARLRRGLRAKQRQLGGEFEVLVWDAAYEQWHRLLFARFLAENGLLVHPDFGAPVTLAECEELAPELSEPDGWSVAARFAAQILPGIFRLDDPCVQLRLAPEHRVALEKIVAGLPADVFMADDSLGWVYQYWQSERKDQVNASEVKIGGADLGPVTQLFTENYMVRFLLENSLGAWWAGRYPDSPLVEDFEYLRFDDDGEPAAGTFDGWPEVVAEVTVMDPCCGSGHFLVEAFGMLWRMRAEEEGLDPVAAQDAVLRDNLFGLELDPRCVQIAMFAVALTAWKQGGGWRHLPTPNIACSGIPAKAPLEEWTALADGDARLEMALERLHALFRDADTLGSLIDPKRAAEAGNGSGPQKTMWDVDFDEVAPLLEKAAARETDHPATAVLGADAAGIARAAALLSGAYTLVATNVPFLSSASFGEVLGHWVREVHEAAKGNLGTAMLDRWGPTDGRAHGTAAVCFSSWLSTKSYAGFRASLVGAAAVKVVARLRSNAFSTMMYDFGVVLLVAERLPPGHAKENESVNYWDAEQERGPRAVAAALRGQMTARLRQSAAFVGEHFNFVAEALADAPALGNRATASVGLHVGDDIRYRRQFWEVGDGANWSRFAGSPDGRRHYSGLDSVIYWPNNGQLHQQNPQARVQGSEAWGQLGVAVRLTGTLPAAIYGGELYSQTICVMVPKLRADLPALLTFLGSPEFHDAVRAFDNSLKVTIGTMLKVPFDLEHWREVAAREFPDGLPEPWSDDPTQWLFEGHPAAATQPLQVGVARLVGYRWPEQPESDGLESHADSDGIVCLPSVGGEQPAADRLTALLADAFGDEWSPARVRSLLEAAGSNKKRLEDWLRDDFFKHHCKVFSNRPFVWHIWDGRKDGFSALVNYHRLDRAGMEKLTFSYLGDWIERQRADADQDVAGADARLAAARQLKGKLEQILEGEDPFDIFVRWKQLHEQPIGWDPDLDDGVRLNIRPFIEVGLLREKVSGLHWKKDRGKNPDGSERHNDIHLTLAQKREARAEAAADG